MGMGNPGGLSTAKAFSVNPTTRIGPFGTGGSWRCAVPYDIPLLQGRLPVHSASLTVMCPS